MNRNIFRLSNSIVNFKWQRVFLPAVTIISIVIGSYISLSHLSRIKEIFALSTYKNNEIFTELYFEDHTNLPKYINPNNTYSFSFTLHNLEGREIVYPYIVYLERVGNKEILDQGIITLENEEYKSRKVTYNPIIKERTQITVELVDKNQSIHFWMEAI